MDFSVTGTLIWYYYICKREVWLMAHQLEANQDDENIRIGKIIGENAYSREKKELDIGSGKLDIIKTENGKLIVGEIKKSSRFLESAIHQLLFYLLQLKEMGVSARGELLIPEERTKIDVVLDENNENDIKQAIKHITHIVNQEFPPEPMKNKYCRNCAYNEFCWA